MAGCDMMPVCRCRGLEDQRHVVGEASYFVAQGGAGPPVLLLHGFPETHAGIVPTLDQFERIGPATVRRADAPDVWRAWATDHSATRLPGGHFIPEEAPRELAETLAAFFGPDAARA